MSVDHSFARIIWGTLALGSAPAASGEPSPAAPAAPALSATRCAELAGEIAALKERMREIGRSAVASSNAQAATQGALAGTAVAGAVLSQVVGVVGHVVSEGAVKAQNATAQSALAATDRRRTSATEATRNIAALTKEHKAGCAQEVKQ